MSNFGQYYTLQYLQAQNSALALLVFLLCTIFRCAEHTFETCGRTDTKSLHCVVAAGTSACTSFSDHCVLYAQFFWHVKSRIFRVLPRQFISRLYCCLCKLKTAHLPCSLSYPAQFSDAPSTRPRPAAAPTQTACTASSLRAPAPPPPCPQCPPPAAPR